MCRHCHVVIALNGGCGVCGGGRGTTGRVHDGRMESLVKSLVDLNK